MIFPQINVIKTRIKLEILPASIYSICTMYIIKKDSTYVLPERRQKVFQFFQEPSTYHTMILRDMYLRREM